MSKKNSTAQPVDPLKQDFRKFLYLVWLHLLLPPPTKRQYALAYFLQHGGRRKAILAFRGIAKSWITVAYVLWLLYCNPQLNILVVSAGEDKATDFTKFAKRIIETMPLLAHLRPKAGQRWTNESFDVGPALNDKDASVSSKGITGQVTGGRAHVMIIDDGEVPKNSQTKKMREKLSYVVFTESNSIIHPADKTTGYAGGEIIILGTPQNSESMYISLEDKGFKVRVLPALYPNERLMKLQGRHLDPELVAELSRDPRLVDQPTEPIRFSKEELAGRQLSMGKTAFDLQYRLDTSLADQDLYPLKLEHLIVHPLRSDRVPNLIGWDNRPDYEYDVEFNPGFSGDRFFRAPPLERDVLSLKPSSIILALDPSGRGKDETAYAVIGELNGTLFLFDAGGFGPGKGYEEDVLEAVAMKAKEWNCTGVLMEENFGMGAIGQLLKPVLNRVYPCPLLPGTRQSQQKEKRIIETLEPVLNQHRLVVNESLIDKDWRSVLNWNIAEDEKPEYRFFYQLSHMQLVQGCLAHDDRLDAVAMGVAHFLKNLSTDAATLAARQLEAQKQAALSQFERRYWDKVRGGRRRMWAERRA